MFCGFYDESINSGTMGEAVSDSGSCRCEEASLEQKGGWERLIDSVNNYPEAPLWEIGCWMK